MEHAFLEGGGGVGDLLRERDWSANELGPIATWPSQLKTLLATVLRARHPMLLWWGPDLIQFYNDAFVPSLGVGKHPASLGQRGRESWAEVWPIVGPQIENVMSRGESFWSEDALVPILRNGRIEEVHWTYGYSPVVDDRGNIAGTLIVCNETTPLVVAERRLQAVRMLVEKTSTCTSASSVIAAANAVIAMTPYELPFAAMYRRDEAGDAPLERFAREHGRVSEPASFPLPEGSHFPGGPWPEPASTAFVVPSKAAADLVWIFGLSPRLPFDAHYRDFILHFVEQIDLAVVRARAVQSRGGMEIERRNLLLQAPMPTALMTGPQHVFELANPLYERMVGRRVVGKTYLEAFPELAGTALPGILDDVYRTGKPFVAPEALVPLDCDGDGTVEDGFFQFNLEALRDVDGQVYGMMAVAFDITDQVKARRALEEAVAEARRMEGKAAAAEELLRSLVDNLPEMAWSARPDGYVDYYNRRWYEYTGTTFAQMEGWGWKSVHDPTMLDEVSERWATSLKTGEAFEMEFPLRAADGELRWFLTRVRPLRDGDGNIARWFGVNTNIHERKEILRQLEAANLAKDEFLATVSHELRTPLTSILGWSRLLSGDTDPERLQKGLSVIERNAKAQAQLIEALLDVSRIISGKMRMSMARVDLASVANAALETAQPSAAARGVRLHVELAPSLGEIVADEDRLTQVIWNLLSNAVKFTTEGGDVWLRLTRTDSVVSITVSDNGKGISPRFLPRVFDRFRQDDSSTTKQHAGLGLGLAIVRHLVELHGGTVTARSAGEGQGASFEVRLPIHAASPRDADRASDRSAHDSAPATPHARLHGVCALVVDDQEDSRELVAVVLEDAGASVVQAGSVAHAMKVLSTAAIEVIVSDIGMPVEDGYDFLQRVRAADSLTTRALPALALTGFARGEDRDKALAAGFQEHIAKPIDPQRLVDVVARLVHR